MVNAKKKNLVVGCLQVNQSEYINDYGAISCPFKVERGQAGRENGIKCLTLTEGVEGPL